ncbi:hypothetical protein [[Clostridium] polysaccharolyticum]|uniref:Uncharacterized protein n=1 Tax=[Clostridium] polysaccharolyticum TaxID=29364 RepID=A0A1H9YIN3_9FIRM|nr:hypothetical protein [[Clostridium] polysaccharolyticum]SES68347.1 hypothetical protein SAMN04487772_10217 [[Clostridium] polysaccharolyticum]
MVLIVDNGIQMFTETSVDSATNPGGGNWIDATTFVILTQTEVAEYTECVKLTEEELDILGISSGVNYYKGHSRHYTRASWDAEHNR